MITEAALRELFESVGEIDVSNEVIQNMIALASRPADLINALVNDLLLFKDNQSVSSTVQLRASITKPSSFANASKVNTSPFLDYSADTFQRPLFVMQLWSAGIASYFAYMVGMYGGNFVSPNCTSDTNSCKIADGIMDWINLFIRICSIGLPYIILGSLGNSSFGFRKSLRIPAIAISMCSIFMVTIYTFFWVSFVYLPA